MHHVMGVVGAGVMGSGIAQLAAQNGFEVRLFDTREGAVDAAKNAIKTILSRLAAKGRIAQEDVSATLSRIVPLGTLDGLSGCELVIEAIVEDLAAKTELMAELEAVVRPSCILATNTSSFLVTSIASRCQRPERIAGLHFFNPVPLMRIVEIVRGSRTSATTTAALNRWVGQVGHTSIEVTDTPGFLVNYAGRAYPSEAARIVQEGIAETHDVDRVMRDVAAFKMGPFELLDLTGLDVSFSVMQQIYHAYFEEPRLRPSPMFRRRVAGGLYGRKTNEGFYKYRDGARIEPDELLWSRPPRQPSVWLDPEAHRAGECLELLKRLPVVIDDGAVAAKDSVIITAPLGMDATTTATNRGFSLDRTVAIDSLFGFERRVTVMPALTVSKQVLNAIAGSIQASGLAVTIICDSPGFIAQRMTASIVNLACTIALERIAKPEDIDKAVKLALAYPFGPFEIAERIGTSTFLTILDNMHAFYGDPRYRASPWLRRRAAHGLPPHFEEIWRAPTAYEGGS
jgi:3-hydroxybutyryl-CoA dehydrogenase